MSKAILILDMPYSCDDCDMFYVDKYYHCYRCKAKYDQSLGDESVVQSWCPLKPLPEEREAFGILNEYERGKILGFNSCLRIILGDKKWKQY